MKKILLLVILLSVGLFSLDVTYKPTLSVSKQVNDVLGLSIAADMETDFDSVSYTEFYIPGITIKLPTEKAFSLKTALYYMLILDGDYKVGENRIRGSFSVSGKVAEVPVAVRNRFEWRMPEGGDAFLRYRPYFKINAPWKWTDAKINLYNSIEGYVTQTFGGFDYELGATASVNQFGFGLAGLLDVNSDGRLDGFQVKTTISYKIQ